MSTSKKARYIQRNLEDQIEEELQSKNLDSYFKTNHLKTESMTDTTQAQAAPAKKQVKISEIIDLLGKGYTRLAKFDKTGTGSIQAHYGLTASQVKETFEHPKLKGKKTKVQSVEIVDDAPGVTPTIIKPKTPKAATTAKVATDADLFK